jgi:hypothetical protein
MIKRSSVIYQKEDPVFACTEDSTIRLWEVRHINANIVASRTPKDIEVIKAIGAYNGENILVIKTMAVSPGRPTNENTGTNQSEI